MTALTTQILELSREELLEAALALQDQLGIEGENDAADLIAPWRDAPLAHIAEIEEVVRVFLLTAASDPATAPAVQDVVASVGRKAFIFGGMEMFAAAAVAIAGMQVIFARGKTSETISIAVSKDGDKETVTINRDVKYGLSGATSTLIQTVLAAFGKK